MRLKNIPQGLEIILSVDKNRKEITIEFEERKVVLEKSPREREETSKQVCLFCGKVGHREVLCPSRVINEGSNRSDSIDLGLRVGPSSPTTKRQLDFRTYDRCDLAGLPSTHRCKDVLTLLTVVVERVSREGTRTENLEADEGDSSVGLQ